MQPGDGTLRIEKIYSHLNGHEWLLVHQRKIWSEIQEIVGEVDANRYKTKISKEKGMRGKHLFAPIELNKRFQMLTKSGGDWVEIGLVTACLYLVMSVPLGYLSRYLEKRWGVKS